MKVAVTFENGEIFQHFGRTSQFKIYDVENREVLSSEVVNTSGEGHGSLALFLKEHNVEILICGGIGDGAQTALKENEIQIFGGVLGKADEAVEAFLKDQLVQSQKASCSHDHGKEGHHHGEHRCGGDHS